MEGKIKKLTDRGFGFIEVTGKSGDIFFHASQLSEGLQFEDLREGDSVEFDMGSSDKGPRAENVRVTS